MKIRAVVHGTDEHSVVRETVLNANKKSPLPVSRPVIPIIVKTRTVAQFDQLMDEIEAMEAEFSVKMPIVHGGIGPVTPNDMIHAEIERKYSNCDVLAVDTTVLPQCRSDTVDVVAFATINDTVNHLRRIVGRKRL